MDHDEKALATTDTGPVPGIDDKRLDPMDARVLGRFASVEPALARIERASELPRPGGFLARDNTPFDLEAVRQSGRKARLELERTTLLQNITRFERGAALARLNIDDKLPSRGPRQGFDVRQPPWECT